MTVEPITISQNPNIKLKSFSGPQIYYTFGYLLCITVNVFAWLRQPTFRCVFSRQFCRCRLNSTIRWILMRTRGVTRGMTRGGTRGITRGNSWKHLFTLTSTESCFTRAEESPDAIYTRATVFACARHALGIALLPAVSLGTWTVEVSYEILKGQWNAGNQMSRQNLMLFTGQNGLMFSRSSLPLFRCRVSNFWTSNESNKPILMYKTSTILDRSNEKFRPPLPHHFNDEKITRFALRAKSSFLFP